MERDAPSSRGGQAVVRRGLEKRLDQKLATTERRAPSVASAASLVAMPMFDNQIDALEQVDVAQHVAFHRDDVGEFPFAD